MTRASPGVAPYPFTTLMPNLGAMAAAAVAAADPSSPRRTKAPVLADLPGLIEGVDGCGGGQLQALAS